MTTAPRWRAEVEEGQRWVEVYEGDHKVGNLRVGYDTAPLLARQINMLDGCRTCRQGEGLPKGVVIGPGVLLARGADIPQGWSRRFNARRDAWSDEEPPESCLDMWYEVRP